MEHHLHTDNTELGSGQMVGSKYVCVKCGHEGPVYPNSSPTLMNKARFHSVVLWNKQEYLTEDDGAYQPRGF